MERKGKEFDWSFLYNSTQGSILEGFWNQLNRIYSKVGPPTDIYKLEDRLVVIADMPGIDSTNKINIRLRGNKLRIQGNIPPLNYSTEENLLYQERFQGRFDREIKLPESIDLNQRINAHFKNGLLIIEIPLLFDGDEQEIPVEFYE